MNCEGLKEFYKFNRNPTRKYNYGIDLNQSGNNEIKFVYEIKLVYKN